MGRLWILFLALWVATAPPVLAQSVDLGKYYALVIGINDYEHLPKLETAVNDASAVHDLLSRKYGFTSRLLLNPTRYEIVAALDALRAELTEDENLLIYYAGHGVLDREADEGYWLAKDAEDGVSANWVSVYGLTRTLRAMTAKHVLVVADSCYSGTLTRDAPASLATGQEREKELRRYAGLRARKALTSGGLEPVLDGGGDGHSVFGRAFLETLRQNNDYLDGTQLYRKLRGRVIRNADQTPNYADIRRANDEGGEFVFVPTIKSEQKKETTASQPGTTPMSGQDMREITFWQSIQNSQDPADFEDFIALYPKSDFVRIAKRRLARLQPAKRTISPPVEPPKSSTATPVKTPKPVQPKDTTLAKVELAPPAPKPVLSEAPVLEAEPNDKHEDGTQFQAGSTISGSILPKGDVDFFRFSLPKQGQLRLTSHTTPEAVDLSARILDNAGRQVWSWQYAAKAGAPFEMTADLPVPGPYILEVRDRYNNAASPDPYQVAVVFTPTSDSQEPNNDIAKATPIPWNQVIAANILPKADADIYAVTLNKQGTLMVDFKNSPDELDMAFRVLDDTGAQAGGWQYAPKTGAPLQAWVDLKKPGRYFLEVRDRYNNGRSAMPYQLTVNHIPTADPAEPNDDLKSATRLPWDQPLRANILPKNDADFYSVEMAHQGELALSFTDVPEELDPSFRVLDHTGNQVWGWQYPVSTGTDYAAWADIKAPGTYVIEVRDRYNNGRSTEPFLLTAARIHTADIDEPNDTLREATPVRFEEKVTANILPKGDVDYYAVRMAKQGMLTLSFTDVPKELDPSFRILNSKGAQVHGWQYPPAAGKDYSAWVDVKSAGDYVIEIRDRYNNERSAQPFNFSAATDYTADPAEPNDTTERATQLPLEQTVAAHILPVSDADMYAVTIPRRGRMTVDFSQVPEALDMAFRVLDLTGNQLSGWQYGEAGKAFRGTVDIVSAGDIILEVRDRYNNGRSPDPYALTVSFR